MGYELFLNQSGFGSKILNFRFGSVIGQNVQIKSGRVRSFVGKVWWSLRTCSVSDPFKLLAVKFHVYVVSTGIHRLQVILQVRAV